MMADLSGPPHSAVMERLRRRIELFRQHHNSCENRYDNATLERLEHERQQTFALHQRCLQAKAKRSNKHRTPTNTNANPQTQQSQAQATVQGSGVETAGQRGSAGGGGGGGSSSELAESGGGSTAEQSRNSTLIALQETVKRKLESAGSPVNGFGDTFPPNKKACLDNGSARSPLDSKLGISDSLSLTHSNGTHNNNNISTGGDSSNTDNARDSLTDFHRKEMKQEPDDILPIMPPSAGGNNSLFPDLNLNEQEWTELMEELNCSVAYEDIQDILNDGFEDRKDPLELAATPNNNNGNNATTSSSSHNNNSNAIMLPPDLVNVKSEFSPASVAFEQESRAGNTGTGSPHVRSTSSGPLSTSSPIANATSSAKSPAQTGPPNSSNQPRQIQPNPNNNNHTNHLHPSSVQKDLSPAQQLQQLAAQQQRAQHLHGQMHQQQHKQPQSGVGVGSAKFHTTHPPPPTPWSQSQLASSAFGLDKPTSPSLYPQDFNPNANAQAKQQQQQQQQQQMLLQQQNAQQNKSSPKSVAVTSSYMPVGPNSVGVGHPPNMMGHSTAGPPLSHPPTVQGTQAQITAAMLNYSNTKPLSHFEAGPGLGQIRPQSAQSNKAALLSLLQRQQLIKQKNSQMTFRQHIPHAQDQNSYAAPPNTMTSPPGNNNVMTTQQQQPGSHGNPGYLSNQAAVAAALKQQQQHQHLLEQQQKQQQYIQQRQQLIEQEKQRQQDQQLQRHLTRPPPQYQDQPGQPATQSPFPQPPGPFTGRTAPSQPMVSVGSMVGPAPGAQRMFPQNPGLLLANQGQGQSQGQLILATGAPPPTGSQSDIAMAAACGGNVDVQQVLYNSMNLHQQRGGQPLGAMSAAYRQNLLAQQQQHLKTQPNAAMLKQQQLAAAAARLPSAMQSLPGAMQQAQSVVWQQQQQQQQQQLANQTTANNHAFHIQQNRINPKMQQGNATSNAAATFGASGRTMVGLTQQQMMQQQQQQQQTNMASAQQQRVPPPNTQQTQQTNQSQAILPADMAAFAQQQAAAAAASNGRQQQGLQCNQGYQVTRTASQMQQQVSFGYNVASGSFAGESELVDSLLKGQSAQEWMADLDELLASHH